MNELTTRGRIAIVLASALALAVTEYGRRMRALHPGTTGHVWGICSLAAEVLAVVAAFVVGRWWAVLPAAAPIAVTFYLYDLTDYVTPWDSESIGSPKDLVLYVVLLLLSFGLSAAILSIGLVARRIWDHRRRRSARSA